MTQDYSNGTPPDPDRDRATLERLQALNTVGTISYVLHLVVAIGALIPGGQFGPVLGMRRTFAGAFARCSSPACCIL
jgi:hypothetical protein